MKFLNAVVVLIILLILNGCNKQQEKVEIAPPKVDLHSAVVTNNLDLIRQHIKAGTDINVLEPTHASTPLITAAALGRPEAAKILIDAGASLDYQNADGSTALHTAAAFGKTEVAKLLIDAGANMNIKNNEGSTALHAAAFLCRTDIVQALLAKGADKTIKNKVGQTALETVQAPFDDVKMVYDAVGAGLKPLGVVLDYEQIKEARPKIAEMLK
jgi:hypothetical protein